MPIPNGTIRITTINGCFYIYVRIFFFNFGLFIHLNFNRKMLFPITDVLIPYKFIKTVLCFILYIDCILYIMFCVHLPTNFIFDTSWSVMLWCKFFFLQFSIIIYKPIHSLKQWMVYKKNIFIWKCTIFCETYVSIQFINKTYCALKPTSL